VRSLHSLNGVRRILKTEFDVSLAKGYLERLLKNPFYKGQFIWEDELYAGTNMPLISPEQFQQVQAVFRGHHKTKYRKHNFAFSGLLRCAYDDCMVTTEIQKNRYTYYRCTGFRGKCELPYFREGEIASRLGKVLEDIHIPDDVLKQLEKSLLTDKGRDAALRKQQGERFRQRLSACWRRFKRAAVSPVWPAAVDVTFQV
jgi:site-specific DNA recombinase